MSIQNAVGRTFAAVDTSTGTALAVPFSNNYTYTGTSIASQTLLGDVTITSAVTGTNGVTTVGFTLANFPNTVFTGILLGNSASSILLSTTIAALGASPTNLYITNDAQSALSVITVPSEAQNISYVACYCRGTLIRTPHGQRPVEELREGDLVDCLNGGVAPVRWIGQRSYSGRFLRANPALRPVRFKVGSLGAGLPARDLLVSPKHSMLIDGVLVPAELLVNDTTIVIETAMDVVEYFHVELPQHDAIWAENVLSESFVDDGSRGMFHNAATFRSMYPQAAGEVEFFAPRVESGAVVDAIRMRLGALAAEVSAAA